MGNTTSPPCTPELNQLSIDIDRDAASDNSGRSVYLSSDGMRVAIGAPQNLPFTSTVSILRVEWYELKSIGGKYRWRELWVDAPRGK